MRGDSLKVLSQHGIDEKFDIVFVDPPYGKGLAFKSLDNLAALDLMTEGACVVVETGRREELPVKVGNLNLVQQKAYGSTQVHYYVNQH